MPDSITPTIPSILRHKATHSEISMAMRSVTGESWTFGDMAHAAFGIAEKLRAHSVRPRYGIVMANGPLFTLSILGATCAGTAVPLNPAYQRDEFIRYFRRLRASCVLVDCHRPEAESAAQELSIPVIRITGTECGDFTKTGNDPDPNQTALVLMTSGSTGEPKLVPLSHRNLCVSAAQVAESVGLTESDVCLSMWELHHIGGLVDLLLAPIISGGSIIATPGFNTALFFRCLREFQPTWFQAVPTALHDMMSAWKKYEMPTPDHSLRFLRSVAAKLPENLQVQLEDAFHVPVIQTFGMTEAGPLITSTRLPPAVSKRGSVGTSCGNEIRVLGGSGRELPAGEQGEIAIRGENVFAGYEGEDEENRARFRNGWFLTGDLGFLDEDGHLYLTGRSKQLINRGGEKINPLEVESTLSEHPQVAEAAAFAVEHRSLGEDVAAAVVLKPGATCTAADLKSFVMERLASFKVPHQILFLDRLPLTGIGKLNRPELANIAKASQNQPASHAQANAIERRLSKIWAKEMNLDSIGIDEKFFVAGGDSLVGVRVLVAVEKWLGNPLPPELITGFSTIRDMARDIESHLAHEKQIPRAGLAPLIRDIHMVMAVGRLPTMKGFPTLKIHPDHNDQEEAPPLFWCFNMPDSEMSSLLNVWDHKSRIIGMFSGTRGKGVSFVPEIAAYYCEVITKQRAGRPFYLGGNCRGGRVVECMLEIFGKSGASPLAMIMMERAPKDMAIKKIPHLLLFGENSIVAAEKRDKWMKFSKKSKGTVRIEALKGGHGEFFNPENVDTLKSNLHHFLETIH